jgi:hypothetical protein
VQEVDPRGGQMPLVVARLLPHVDDGTNPVAGCQLGRALGRKAASDRDILGQPMQIRRPFLCRIGHRFFFIFFCISIFFFIIAQVSLLLFCT